MKKVLVFAAVLALAAGACTSSHKKKAAPPVDLKVGVLFTTTGQGGDLASAVLGSAKMAADAASKLHVKMSLNEADYGGDVKRVPRILDGLAAKVDAIVVGTDDIGVLPALRSVSVPVLHPIETADDAVSDDQTTFRFAPSDRLEASKTVQFLLDHRKYDRVAIVADRTPFGDEGVRDLGDAFAKAGATPAAVYRFDQGGDIHTPVAAVGQKNADAAIVWTSSPGEAARIVVEQHKMNFAYQLVFSGNLATASFAKSASAQVTPVAYREGMLSVGAWAGPWFNLERIISFYRDFQSQNSALAPVQAAAVYDSLLALADAAHRRDASPQGLTGGLESLTDFAHAGVPVTISPSKHDGVDLDDLGMYAFTKNQDAPGGDWQPEVNTGGGFFTIVDASLDLPPQYAYLSATS